MSNSEFAIPGQSNIILVAPHGYMGKPPDDEQTALITHKMQKMLNCYAVINDVYRKPSEGALVRFDKEEKICNFNNMVEYKDEDPALYEAFVGPIKLFKEEIKGRGQVPYIFHIHGASTAKFDNACKKVDAIRHKDINILIGTGRGASAKDKEESLTAPPEDVDSLIACLKEEQLIAYSTNHREYAAKKAFNLNQLFREPNDNDEQVLSFQLEIRKQGLRNNKVTAKQTSRRLAAAIGKFTKVAIFPEADVMEPDEALPVSQEKIIEAADTVIGIFQRAANEAMFRVGNYLVETFFGDDFERASNPRDIDNNESLLQLSKKLGEYEGWRPSKTWVYDSVKVTVAFYLFDDFQTFGNLSNSHKVKLAYEDEEVKNELIPLCFAEKWSVRRLNDELAKRKAGEESPAMTMLSLVSKPEKLFAAYPDNTIQKRFNELKPEEQAAIKKKAEKQIQKMDEELKELAALKLRYEELLNG